MSDRAHRAARRWWLVAAVLLAAALRFWQLGSLPPGFYHDEAYNGLDALALLRGEVFPRFYEGWELYSAEAHADRPPTPTRRPIFFEGNYGREPAHIYLMAQSIRLLGATPLAVRAVPALAGTLAVLTTALAAAVLWPAAGQRHTGRAWLDELLSVPVLAALTLAVLFPALHFSRFGLRAMVFVPVETLAVYAFWRGVRSTSRRALWGWWLGAGALLGAGLYVYAAARLLPLVFAGFVALWLLRDRAARRRYLLPFVGLVLTAVAVALPLLLYFWRYPYFLVFRTAYVANKGKGTVEGRPWVTWGLNIGRIIRGLYWQGETHLRHNLPGRPYLDPLQAACFTVGLFAGGQQRRREAGFLLLWLVVMLLPSILSGDAPHFGRLTGAAPVIAIVVAVGLQRVATALQRRQPRLVAPLVALALLASSALTSHAYFVAYAGEPRLRDNVDGFYLPDWELGQTLAAEAPDAVLTLAPHQEEMATIYFALGDSAENLRTIAADGSAVPLGVPGRPAVYVVRPTAEGARSRIAAAFPDQPFAPAGDVLRLALPADELPAFTGSAAAGVPVRLHPALSLLDAGYSLHEDSLVVTLVWQRHSAPLDGDYTAFLHVLDATGTIVAQVDRQPDGYPTGDWRPGERVRDTFTIPLDAAARAAFPTVTLRTGFYDLATLTPFGTPAHLPIPNP